MNICRYCLKALENPVKTVSYWSHISDVCHAECKVDGEKSEAIECQIIDADCNDCKYFKRGKIIPLSDNCLNQIKLGKVPKFSSEAWNGHCLKFDRETVAFPNKWTGRECFQHRSLK